MSTITNVVSLSAARAAKQTENAMLDYQARLLSMDKVELLEEMVTFQRERTQKGELTMDMILRGRYLFRLLEENAETEELRVLTRTYRRHLDHEFTALRHQATS